MDFAEKEIVVVNALGLLVDLLFAHLVRITVYPINVSQQVIVVVHLRFEIDPLLNCYLN